MSIILTAEIAASAAVRCESVFLSATSSQVLPWSPATNARFYQGPLNRQALQAAGFQLKADGTLVDVKNRHISVGKLKTFETKYLFEWEDRDIHQVLMSGGVSHTWMAEIIKEPGQLAGKGFYVSVDPRDSENYGTHLTTFETRGPVILLRADNIYDFRNGEATSKMVTRLAQAGVDGLTYSGYQETWIAMISNRH